MMWNMHGTSSHIITQQQLTTFPQRGRQPVKGSCLLMNKCKPDFSIDSYQYHLSLCGGVRFLLEGRQLAVSLFPAMSREG